MVKDNGWGLGRILGELKKLGIRKICKTTVRNILLEYGFDPGPKRGEGTWDDFIKIHTKTLWACDFFSKKVWTIGGLVEYFVLVLHPTQYAESSYRWQLPILLLEGGLASGRFVQHVTFRGLMLPIPCESRALRTGSLYNDVGLYG